MLWFPFVALLILSPVLLMAGIYWTINRYQCLSSDLAAAERDGEVSGTDCEQPLGLQGEIVALEVQFLLSPLAAIREAEARLGILDSPHWRLVTAQPTTHEVLRITFEDLMRRIEHAPRIRR